MDIANATRALAALAQQTRLRVFRLLVEQGPEGMPATEIASELGVRQNLMSTHLSILANANITVARRDGRRVFHAVDFDHTRDLVGFLLEDCCHGSPDKCANFLDDLLPADQNGICRTA